MNSTAKRLGNTCAVVVLAIQGSDSSHGRAMVTLATRRTVRRETGWADIFVLITSRFLCVQGFRPSFTQELRAGDDCLYQRAEMIPVGGQCRSHTLNCRLVG